MQKWQSDTNVTKRKQYLSHNLRVSQNQQPPILSYENTRFWQTNGMYGKINRAWYVFSPRNHIWTCSSSKLILFWMPLYCVIVLLLTGFIWNKHRPLGMKSLILSFLTLTQGDDSSRCFDVTLLYYVTTSLKTKLEEECKERKHRSNFGKVWKSKEISRKAHKISEQRVVFWKPRLPSGILLDSCEWLVWLNHTSLSSWWYLARAT